MSPNVSPFKNSNELRTDPTKSNYYVIGPVKGRVELLRKLLLGIEKSGTFCRNDKIIFMGDMIGGDSTAETIQFMLDYYELRKDQLVFLMGRTEHYFAKSSPSFFRTETGRNITNSYRKERTSYVASVLPKAKPYIDIKKLAMHRRMVSKLPMKFETKSYVFVHGGVNLAKPLKDQQDHSVLFLNQQVREMSKHVEGKVVVNVDMAEEKVKVKDWSVTFGHKDDTLYCAVMTDSSKFCVDTIISETIGKKDGQT
jgi:hypothetical protein